MYRKSGFAEKLKIQNFVNSAELCTLYMYEISGFAKKLNILKYIIQR